MAARRTIGQIERDAMRHRLPEERAARVNEALERGLHECDSSLSSLKAIQMVLRGESIDMMRPLTMGAIAESGGALDVAIGFLDEGEYAPREIRNAKLEIRWPNGDIHKAATAKLKPRI